MNPFFHASPFDTLLLPLNLNPYNNKWYKQQRNAFHSLLVNDYQAKKMGRNPRLTAHLQSKGEQVINKIPY